MSLYYVPFNKTFCLFSFCYRWVCTLVDHNFIHEFILGGRVSTEDMTRRSILLWSELIDIWCWVDTIFLRTLITIIGVSCLSFCLSTSYQQYIGNQWISRWGRFLLLPVNPLNEWVSMYWTSRNTGRTWRVVHFLRKVLRSPKPRF